MIKKNNFIFLLILLLVISTNISKAEGISVDAGLTPGQDRIILRMQYRNILLKWGNDNVIVNTIPLVVAYGLTPDVTLMMRNIYRSVGTNETMMEMDNRWMDPFFMGKVKLLRVNTREYTLGLAAFAGSSFPLLKTSSEKTYSPVVGLNASFRTGSWAFDLNNAYEWVNYNSPKKQSETRQLQLNLAVSRNFAFPEIRNLVFSPVQEFSFVHDSSGSGENEMFGFISPGFQLISPHFKIECLYQVPFNLKSSTSLKNGSRFIVGFRLMF